MSFLYIFCFYIYITTLFCHINYFIKCNKEIGVFILIYRRIKWCDHMKNRDYLTGNKNIDQKKENVNGAKRVGDL